MITKHSFHSGKGDGPDSTFVKPSDWNAEHTITVENTAVWLGRDASGPGAVQEFAIDHATPTDDFTMMTKAQVTAAIAAALAGVDIAVTGDLVATLAATKPGWLLANGQSVGNVGSTAAFANASAQNLFNMLWAINGATWPVLPTRGASAAADWAALKTVVSPDARGCVVGMVDLAAGVNALIATLGVKVGVDKRALLVSEMPSHEHPNGMTAGGPAILVTGGLTQIPTPIPTGVVGGSQPSTIVQPTIGANIFIKL